jgi:hypothetical protein
MRNHIAGENMAKKPKPKPDDKAQSQRFVEAAKLLGIDENSKLFEQATRIIIPSKEKGNANKK